MNIETHNANVYSFVKNENVCKQMSAKQFNQIYGIIFSPSSGYPVNYFKKSTFLDNHIKSEYSNILADLFIECLCCLCMHECVFHALKVSDYLVLSDIHTSAVPPPKFEFRLRTWIWVLPTSILQIVKTHNLFVPTPWLLHIYRVLWL